VTSRVRGLVILQSALVLVTIGCLSTTSSRPAAQKDYELRVDLSGRTFTEGEEIVASISVHNHSPQAVTIVKPLLPSAWSVQYYGPPPGTRPLSGWDGGVLQGTTDPEFSRTYPESEYEVVKPLGAYSQPIDLRWFLRNQRESFPSGCYSLTFSYRLPTGNPERVVPILRATLSSEPVQVCVASRK
jgi:hypothetical protein